MISAITHLGIMVPYSDTLLTEVKNRGSDRADDLPEFTVRKRGRAGLEPGLLAPERRPLREQPDTAGINPSPFSRGPPPAIAFKESRSDGRFSSPGPSCHRRACARCPPNSPVALRHGTINKRGSLGEESGCPNGAICLLRLVFEIVYVSCRVSVLYSRDLFVMEEKSLQLSSYPPGAVLMTGWPAAGLSSRHRQRLGGSPRPPQGTPTVICCWAHSKHVKPT